MSTGALRIRQIITPSKNFGGKQKGMQPTASIFQHLTISETIRFNPMIMPPCLSNE